MPSSLAWLVFQLSTYFLISIPEFQGIFSDNNYVSIRIVTWIMVQRNATYADRLKPRKENFIVVRVISFCLTTFTG